MSAQIIEPSSISNTDEIQYKHEGRRYHANENAGYILPEDEIGKYIICITARKKR